MKQKYELIIEYIEKLVTSKHLKQGDKLPSIRNVAQLFECNKSTVIRAYKELEQMHKVYVINKGGYYLVDQGAQNTQLTQLIDFTELNPDPTLLPYKEFNHCMNRAIDVYKSSLFTYCDVKGLPSFRTTLVNHFREFNIYTKEERIFITSGAQQALHILTQMIMNNQTILVEQPTYHLMIELAKLHQKKVIGINRNEHGIDFYQLEEIFKKEKIKFFYTMPRLHSPLGTSYTNKDKQKIIELAEKYNVYIIEDDYLVDLDQSKNNLPLFYYDLSDRVIYIKSFSKSFMPGIRIGAVILPLSLQDEFLKYKMLDDLSTSVLNQGALEIFINSRMYQKHIVKIQSEYMKKIECVRSCIANFNINQNISVNIPSNGFVVWFNLHESINVEQFIKKMKSKNIIIASPSKYYINREPKHCFALCISKLSLTDISTGINSILSELGQYR